jgi:kynurenine formamidase
MLIELSYEFAENIPVYPGSPNERFRGVQMIVKGDVCNASVIEHYTHAGTHVDAPYHFDNEGRTIDEIPIADFLFERPVLIECPLEASGLILVDHILGNPNAFRADILFFHTGYAEKRPDTRIYTGDFPALSKEAALFIRNELATVKAVAIDTLSIESSVQGPLLNFPIHKALLDMKVSSKRTLLIFEDVNIARLIGRDVQKIYSFPLRFRGLEGSPVSMVAEVR